MDTRLPLRLATPGAGPQVPERLAGVGWEFRHFAPSVASARIQGFHWYPGQFPEPLVTALLDCLPPGSGRFLDPFCGSGTAPFEAWTHGYAAIGSDANTQALRIARARTLLVQAASIEVGEGLVQSYRHFRDPSASSRPTSIADAGMHPEAALWFRPDVLAEIASAKQWVCEQPEPWREILYVVLSSVLHSVSELRDVPHSFIADRAMPGTPASSPVDFPASFATRIRWAVRRGAERQAEIPGGVSAPSYIRAVSAASVVPPASIDLIITSPPYYGILDYTRSQYLTWLVWPWDAYQADIEAEVGVRRLRWSPRRLEEYLQAMEHSIADMAKALRPGAYLALVVGQSRCSFVQAQNPLASLRTMVADAGLEWIWKRRRSVRFRKVNRTPGTDEEIWVLRR